MSYRQTETDIAMNDRTDSELMQAYRLGNSEAFEILYKRYRARLYVYAYSLLRRVQESQDAMHEVFTKLIANTAAFSRANNVSAFLFAVCRNYCINVLKSRKNSEVPLPDFQILKADGPAKEAARHEETELLNRIIGGLPEKQREVLVMKVYGRLTFQQIARTTGQPGHGSDPVPPGDQEVKVGPADAGGKT